MADPLLLIVLFAVVAIAAVSVWLSCAPFDCTIAHALRRELKGSNRTEADRIASHEHEGAELSATDRAVSSPLLSAIALFLSPVPFGVISWLYVRPYVYEPWGERAFLEYFFFVILGVSVPVILLAILLGAIGVARYKTAFSKIVCAITITVPFVCVLWLLFFS